VTSVSFSCMCRHFDLWNRLTQRHLCDKGHLELKVHLYWLENESYDVRCRETKMYADGQEVMKGDVVRRGSEVGQVLEIIPNGVGAQENALVQWNTVIEISPGIRGLKPPVQEPTQTLTFVRRKP
jgi:hypothetical protein